ncbi:MAG: Gldg family protein [Verrucomicrobiota bacterium]
MKTSQKWLAFLILIVALILVTIISSYIPGQIDFTAEKSFTLSKGSKNLIKKIEDPIQMTFYFSRDIQEIPIFYKNFAKRIEGLLRQYSRASGGKITVDTIVPRPDSDEEIAATRSGVESQQLASGSGFFFGLVLNQADQEEVIAVFNPRREALLEYDITQAIFKLQNFKKPKLGFITSLPAFGGPGLSPQFGGSGRPTEKWVLISELENSFTVEQVETKAERLPTDLDSLLILHPQNLPESLLFDIDQFLLKGKPVVIAVDPNNILQRRNMPNPMMMGGRQPDTSSDLPLLFAKWGIQYDAKKVVADFGLATALGGSRGNTSPIITWLSVNDVPKDIPATAQLDNILLANAGSFTVTEESGLELTPLITSTTQADLVGSSLIDTMQPAQLASNVVPRGKAYNIAGIVSGRFKSAFPDGIVLAPEPPADEENKETPVPIKIPAGLTASKDTSKLILITDADFMSDALSVQKFQILGTTAVQPMNDNLSLATNVVDYVAGSEDLISIRGKGTSARTFTLVRDIQLKAEKEYREEEQVIERQLGKVRQELADLQKQTKDKGRLVASASFRESIKKLQEQEATVLVKRREIRKKLREDIEGLNRILAGFNLIIMPLCITAFGLIYFSSRNKKHTA